MSLSRRQLRTLRGIERDLACSDPNLDEFFLFFAEGFPGHEMPRAERVTCWPCEVLAKLWRGRNVSERVAIWCTGNRHRP